MQRFTFTPFATARAFIATGAFWGVVGAIVGVLGAIKLLAPDLAGSTPYLIFSRLRPAHVNLVLFGFVHSLMLGAAAYIVPSLCRLESLWSERLGVLSAVVWNLV